jgi:hypothetical protein
MKETAVTTLIYPDWYMEEMTDDISSEVITLWEVKKAVTINFDMDEWNEYQSLKWIAKNNYLREKTLELMNWVNSKIDKLVAWNHLWYKGTF